MKIDPKTIEEHLQSLKKMTQFFRALQEKTIVLHEVNPPAQDPDYLEEFTYLKDLLKTEDWPEAIEEEMIVRTEDDKVARASGSLEQFLVEDDLPDAHEFIKSKLTGAKVLDFGCGEGHLIKEVKKSEPLVALGYDIKKQWGDEDYLTTDMELIRAAAPFDMIFVYDVLDHVQIDPTEILKTLKDLKRPSGRIYLRCHPYVSRTGTHLYKTLNRAYAHLVFTEEELIKLGHKNVFTNKLLRPLTEYRNWIRTAGLSVVTESLVRMPVERFFYDDLVSARINKHFSDTRMSPALELQAVDYILE